MYQHTTLYWEKGACEMCGCTVYDVLTRTEKGYRPLRIQCSVCARQYDCKYPDNNVENSSEQNEETQNEEMDESDD